MKSQTATHPNSSCTRKQAAVITISIRRSVIKGVAVSTPRTGKLAVAGAVLAGLALSETLFHTRGSQAQTHSVHAKLRV